MIDLLLSERFASILIHLGLVFVLPPLLLGVINKIKALVGGRVGPPVLQLYYDLFKLWRKGSVVSTTTTWVFRAGPVAAVSCSVMASLLVPLGHHQAPVSFTGDVILFAYLFGLARFLAGVSALDTGSSFEGMGAAREMTFSALAEPALFVGLAVLAKLGSCYSLTPMLASAAAGWATSTAPLVLVLAGWLIVLLVENCRIPVDDPSTHLELTMIHEVMVLDHSGPSFALVLYGASMKLLLLGALVVDLCLPWSGNPWLDWAILVGGMLVLAVVIGIIESSMARLRLPRIPELLVAAVVACTFGFFLTVF